MAYRFMSTTEIEDLFADISNVNEGWFDVQSLKVYAKQQLVVYESEPELIIHTLIVVTDIFCDSYGIKVRLLDMKTGDIHTVKYVPQYLFRYGVATRLPVRSVIDRVVRTDGKHNQHSFYTYIESLQINEVKLTTMAKLRKEFGADKVRRALEDAQ